MPTSRDFCFCIIPVSPTIASTPFRWDTSFVIIIKKERKYNNITEALFLTFIVGRCRYGGPLETNER